MEATSILAPNERCVRAKLQLFLRLWSVRQKYEHQRPFGNSGPARFRFHVTYLRACWEKVVEFQRAIGLELIQFAPRDQFEMIYVVTAFADREMHHRDSTILDTYGYWHNYRTALDRLSYELNPFDFAEACSYCAETIRDLCAPAPVIERIPFTPTENVRLHEFPRRLVLQSA